jgi:hypothetical protein
MKDSDDNERDLFLEAMRDVRRMRSTAGPPGSPKPVSTRSTAPGR